MTAVELRVPRDDEAEAVAELTAASWPEPLTETTIRRVWSSPTFELQRDGRVAADEDGRVVGYVEVERPGEGADKLWMYVFGDPVADLLDWGERRAGEERGNGGVRLLSGGWSKSARLLDAFADRGYRRVRASYRMSVELTGDLEQPFWPAGIEPRCFRPGDERAVYEVHQETFADSWEHSRRSYDEWAHWFLSPPFHHPDLWLLAVESGEVAGLALCWPDEALQQVGWVGILGVRRPWRRRGLGRALLLQAFDEFRGRGFERVLLGVDAESLTGAHRLYASAGMEVADSFEIYEKTLAASDP